MQAVNTFKTYSGLTVLIAGAIHVVCFALIITAIQKQEHAMTDMHEAGGSQRFLQRVSGSAIRAWNDQAHATYLCTCCGHVTNCVSILLDAGTGVGPCAGQCI